MIRSSAGLVCARVRRQPRLWRRSQRALLRKCQSSPVLVRPIRQFEPSNAAHGEDGCVQKNREVHKEVAMLDVVEIVLKVFMDQEGTVPTELPKASKPGFDLKAFGIFLS